MSKSNRMEFLMDDELCEELTKYADGVNWSKSEVVREAVREYLLKRDKYGKQQEIQSLHRRVADHELEANYLRKRITELEEFEDRPHHTEKSYPEAQKTIKAIINAGNLVEQDFLIQSRKCGMALEDFKQQLRNDGVITDENE